MYHEILQVLEDRALTPGMVMVMITIIKNKLHSGGGMMEKKRLVNFAAIDNLNLHLRVFL
ncbi:MAG: hypothetical protein KKF78_05185 [Candidatus Omnitrophica bacterium]|nr:hypothetical protein [Candidatus Omnitrophota bacterium]MBU1996530.1 hypothetical protein [Candidatus Omnitrophota bacterium]